ncbi:hypothetical protein EMPG_11471 [Blastomyces silverae]|uniref:Uncharacterized protein n=1 Tax=Blastomyces silverae TaxID=2060906 RepID=A0A0H1BR47_9EURO|nr:hypothetical protein EMPG_11471 [Blastomyces silverae]
MVLSREVVDGVSCTVHRKPGSVVAQSPVKFFGECKIAKCSRCDNSSPPLVCPQLPLQPIYKTPNRTTPPHSNVSFSFTTHTNHNGQTTTRKIAYCCYYYCCCCFHHHQYYRQYRP